MSYTITAAEINTGMTITDEQAGIKRTLTVATIEREDCWIALWSAEGGIICIRPYTQVMVEGDRPVSTYPVGTVLRVPGVGSIVKVGEAGSTQWISVETGNRIRPGVVDGFYGVSVVYSPESDNEVTEVPDVVEEKDWQRDNVEWRRHDWADADGDVWEWYEGVHGWRVVRVNGETRYESGPGLNVATFPVTRVK